MPLKRQQQATRPSRLRLPRSSNSGDTNGTTAVGSGKDASPRGDAIGNHLDSSIAIMAARIQDRAALQVEETSLLEQAQANLYTWQAKETTAKAAAEKAHAACLQDVQDKQACELQVLQLRQEIQETKAKTAVLEQETIQCTQQLQMQQSAWKETLVALVCPHTVQTQLYTKVLQSKLDKKQAALTKRQGRLDWLSQQTQRLQQDRDWMLQQAAHSKEQVVSLRKALADTTSQTEQQVQAVHAALAKRTQLRQELVAAKKLHDAAHETLVERERQYQEARDV